MKGENKNVIFLLIIFIAILIVSIASATFAFFASNVDAESSMPMTVIAKPPRTVFNTMGADIPLDVTLNNMNYFGEKGIAASNSGSLVVSYLSGNDEESSCHYNVYYNPAPGSDGYVPSIGYDPITKKEFTYEVHGKEDGTSLLDIDETNFLSSNEGPFPVKLNSEPIYITNSSDVEQTEHVYEISVKFYNIDVNQNSNSGKQFHMLFFVDDVEC